MTSLWHPFDSHYFPSVAVELDRNRELASASLVDVALHDGPLVVKEAVRSATVGVVTATVLPVEVLLDALFIGAGYAASEGRRDGNNCKAFEP
jgi:hypothetical protein